jgi:hypothetical protein
VGTPIRITSGNMRMSDSDALPAGDLGALRRVYDSRGGVGVFGKGWTSIFDARATMNGGTDGRDTVYIAADDGERYVFERTGGTYTQRYPAGQRYPTTLIYDTSRSVFIHRNGTSSLVRVYRASDGRLVGIRQAAHPYETIITYDANGKPASLQEAHGAWAWTIAMNTSGTIASIAVDGEPTLTWTYGYDAQQNLQTVANASGTWRTYVYGPLGMEEARDGAGRLIEAHQYDAVGNALTSQQQSDDVTDIDYDLPGRVAGETATRVTYAGGRETLYYSRYIAGKMRTVEVAGSCNCGTEDTVYGYDGEGHIAREQNARGYVTTRLFNGDRLLEEIGPLRPSSCDPATDPARCRLTPDTLQMCC